MITFRWTQLLVAAFFFAAGLVLGIIWQLPFDQASNFFFLLIGLLVGVIGIAATLWVATRDRELRLGEIRTAIADTKESVAALRELATQMWQPALSAVIGLQPQDVGMKVSEQLRQSAQEVEVVLDRKVDERINAVTSIPDGKRGAQAQPDLQHLKEELRQDIQEATKSITQQTLLMTRVAQIATLTEVERFMLRRLLHPVWGEAEWHRAANWTTWAVPGTCPFPSETISEAIQRLMSLGLVVRRPSPPQVTVGLAPGIKESLEKYEEMFGPIRPTREEERELEKRRIAELAQQKSNLYPRE
ncbi:MAG: hypothetical protein EPO21_21945 [Chloroflexota bacterium]|nr:MAG: hypothetical protein EPO21_21945 [Chloroflexota bacterium]